jgi:hypothetical protein
MPTNIPQAMLDEVRGLNRIHWVLELTDGSTTLQYADHPVASESEGLYKSNLVSWADIVSDLGDDNYSLVSSRSSVRIYDDDRTFQHFIAETAAGTLLDFDINIWLRSFYVTAANHYKRLSGKVRDYRLVGNRTWEIVYGPPDKEINSPIRIIEINKTDFQVAFGAGGGDQVPDEVVGNPTQIVYGEHSSIGTGQAGMITAEPYADEDLVSNLSYWFASWGTLEEVTRVYVDGTDETSSSTFGATETPLNKTYTGITLPIATAPLTSTVTFDCLGVTDSNTSTGTAIRNPADILRHVLVNFIFQEYSTADAWESETGLPIDYDLFDTAADFFNTHGIEGSAVFATGITGSSIINTFGSSFFANVFWTTLFELGLHIDDYGLVDTYLTSDEHIRQDKGYFLSDLTMRSLGDKQVKDTITNSVFSQGGSSGKVTRSSFEALREQQIINIKYGKAALL